MKSRPIKTSSRPIRRRRSTRVLLMSLGLTVALTASSTFALVVHDPGQLTENLRQVLAVLDQIDRATVQIRNQWKMLQKLPVSVGRSLEIAGDRLSLDDWLNGGVTYPVCLTLVSEVDEIDDIKGRSNLGGDGVSPPTSRSNLYFTLK